MGKYKPLAAGYLQAEIITVWRLPV